MSKLISFIIVAKNEAPRIDLVINSIIKYRKKNIEIIIVDDFSNDMTYKISKKFSKEFKFIKVFRNKIKGKVIGTNFGYRKSKGEIIKFIDGDDILLPGFYKELYKIKNGFSHCHSANIVNNELKYIAKYNINNQILSKSVKDVIINLISPPKWCWTFSRVVTEKIFPIPKEMPIEDLWISIRAKEFSKKIIVTNKPLYLYRQHYGQDYGGILNYNYKLVKLRAQRSIKTINLLKKIKSYKQYNFQYLENYLHIIINRSGILKILFSDFLLRDKIKAILMLYFPKISSYLTILKWKIDGYNLEKNLSENG
jgi:glycosyltransferase involved in cell wall biosynthesis